MGRGSRTAVCSCRRLKYTIQGILGFPSAIRSKRAEVDRQIANVAARCKDEYDAGLNMELPSSELRARERSLKVLPGRSIHSIVIVLGERYRTRANTIESARILARDDVWRELFFMSADWWCIGLAGNPSRDDRSPRYIHNEFYSRLFYRARDFPSVNTSEWNTGTSEKGDDSVLTAGNSRCQDRALSLTSFVPRFYPPTRDPASSRSSSRT